MNPAHLEKIELRLAGATHTPWQLRTPPSRFDSPNASPGDLEAANSVLCYVMNSRPLKHIPSDDGGDPLVRQGMLDDRTVCTLHRDSFADLDVAKFLVHAPTDMEALVREVKRQREEIETLDIMVITHKKRAREERAKAADLQAQLTKLTTALATVREVLDADQQNTVD